MRENSNEKKRSASCDYCIVGDQNPLAAQYQLVRKENGLLVSE